MFKQNPQLLSIIILSINTTWLVVVCLTVSISSSHVFLCWYHANVYYALFKERCLLVSVFVPPMSVASRVGQSHSERSEQDRAQRLQSRGPARAMSRQAHCGGSYFYIFVVCYCVYIFYSLLLCFNFIQFIKFVFINKINISFIING